MYPHNNQDYPFHVVPDVQHPCPPLHVVPDVHHPPQLHIHTDFHSPDYTPPASASSYASTATAYPPLTPPSAPDEYQYQHWQPDHDQVYAPAPSDQWSPAYHTEPTQSPPSHGPGLIFTDPLSRQDLPEAPASPPEPAYHHHYSDPAATWAQPEVNPPYHHQDASWTEPVYEQQPAQYQPPTYHEQRDEHFYQEHEHSPEHFYPAQEPQAQPQHVSSAREEQFYEQPQHEHSPEHFYPAQEHPCPQARHDQRSPPRDEHFYPAQEQPRPQPQPQSQPLHQPQPRPQPAHQSYPPIAPPRLVEHIPRISQSQRASAPAPAPTPAAAPAPAPAPPPVSAPAPPPRSPPRPPPPADEERLPRPPVVPSQSHLRRPHAHASPQQQPFRPFHPYPAHQRTPPSSTSSTTTSITPRIHYHDGLDGGCMPPPPVFGLFGSYPLSRGPRELPLPGPTCAPATSSSVMRLVLTPPVKRPPAPAPPASAAAPAPPTRRPRMACYFCRKRKIACGPGPAAVRTANGGKDKGCFEDDGPCNQCARRGLECERPTESKRGVRKGKGKGKDGEEGNPRPVASGSGVTLELSPRPRPVVNQAQGQEDDDEYEEYEDDDGEYEDDGEDDDGDQHG